MRPQIQILNFAIYGHKVTKVNQIWCVFLCIYDIVKMTSLKMRYEPICLERERDTETEMGEGKEKQRTKKDGGDKNGVSHSNSSQNRLPSSSRKVMKKAEEGPELPMDVLNIITKKLDIDDLFSFGEVCKNWRISRSSFWVNFMACQAPLVIQKTPHAKRACSFFSISDRRMYNAWLPYFSGFAHAGFSNGYLIMAGTHNTLLLINPFARKQMKIPGSQDQGSFTDLYDRVMLAFAVKSQEFVIVALCTWSYNVHVYQSRNSRWTIYSRWGNPLKVMDAVVFNRTLYAITDNAKIGVLKLNSPSLNFLQLNNTPIFFSSNLNLVSSNGQLLVVHFKPSVYLEVYRINFSTMEWIRLETLEERALFLSATKATALSNPGMWGFDSNRVYSIDRTSSVCRVFSMNNQLIRTISLPENRPPFKSKLCNVDWCFRHLREEIDYSHHE